MRLSCERISALRPGNGGGLLREISIRLPAGRCLALLGDETSGGSLLLDVIAGHHRPSIGTLTIDDAAPDRASRSSGRPGLVSDRDPLFPHLDARGNIAFPLRARGTPVAERDRRVAEAIALLGLDGLSNRRPAALDAEHRVRTALARAMVADPPLLLLDDPFNRLPAGPRAALQRMLRRLVRARGLTVLLCTADRDEALLLGDEIGILDRGRLHQAGPADALLDRPADVVVARRLGDANLLTGQVLEVEDDIAVIQLACGRRMEAELGQPLGRGAICVLCVRPDRIATAFLSRPGTETDRDMLPAILQDAVNFGDHLRLRFRLEDGSEVLVRRPPAAAMGELRPDRPALLAWQPHHARAFAAEAGS